MKRLVGVLGAVLVLLATVAHGKATVVIVNADDAGVGFNDPTPVVAIGGNCGTTLGAQRLVVFQKAAEIWGNALESSAPITVLSHFQPLTCTSGGATLGSAGPTNIFASDDPTLPAGVPGSVFPKPHTWYVSALSGAFAGRALVSGTGTASTNYDILAQFNSTLDDPNATNCNGFRWYYGLDNNHGDKLDLLTVVLHEFGHGLGFISLANPQTGVFPQNEPDIWASYQYDEGSGMHWVDLTDATRAASAISGGLAWDGPVVKGAVPSVSGTGPLVHITSAPATPSVVTDYPEVSVAQFSAPITAAGVSGSLALGSTGYGCSLQGRMDPLDGKIAIVDRGGPAPDAGCTFVEKARNAQDAGAIGLLVANNTSNPALIPPGGTAPDIVIPVLLMTQADGAALKGAVGAGTVTGSILVGTYQGLRGVDSSNRPPLFAPNPFESGSSVSHWDPIVTPNLLMEPVINGDLTHTLDLTPGLMQDIGWTLADGGNLIDAGICTGGGGGGGPDAGGSGGGGSGATGGCTTALGQPAPWLALLGLLALVRRRRRA